ncbi:MAG: GNAT family N-acetyltransferase [Acidobacteriota bacterium]
MDKNKFKIRDYKSDDYDQIIELWKKTGLGGVERGDDSAVIELSLELGGKLFVMESSSDKKVIGTSWITFDGRRLHLHHFGIDPQFQGNGYSKALLRESLAFAKKKNVQIKLEVHKDNEKAINLYGDFGFKYLGNYVIFIIRDLTEIKF